MDTEHCLKKGFLPVETPPCFSTHAFAQKVSSLGAHPPLKDWTEPVRYSLVRAGGVRRSTEIPNPFSQYHLVDLCAKNWTSLRGISARSKISLSRPLRGPGVRSLRHFKPIEQWGRELVSRMPGGRVTLTTDISQFYPSIYTHAVDWCVRGKRAAKGNMRAAGLGPELDKLLRNGRGGQTVGIPVGPDTSWLIAEMLLAQVDAELCARFPTAVKRTARFGDDMTVYATSVGEAEDILATYQELLREYELAINPVKVAIVDGLLPVEPPWVRKLRAHRYRDDRDRNQAGDVMDIFGVALEERGTFPDQGVLNYALKRCDPFPAGADGWRVYRDIILASVGLDASTLPTAFAVLDFARKRSLPIDIDTTSDVFNELIVRHARLGHGFEVSWILFAIRTLGLVLESDTANEVAKMQDNCSLILLGDLLSRGSKVLRANASMGSVLKRAEVEGALSSSDWLMAYEYRHRGWCKPAKWDNSKSWKEIHDKGVSFLYSNSPRRQIRRRKPSFMPAWQYVNPSASANKSTGSALP
ncbi:RNA-directed DNA polymerase [Nocardia thailandica]|uniref:RNA-directed DNA polymerase n=1 Tax=Nocardia thailandica TaxID=257275 RepID=A0ABW6PKD9_9NOCA